MTDDTPTPEECERLARSIAMSGSLGARDRLRVMEHCDGSPDSSTRGASSAIECVLS